MKSKSIQPKHLIFLIDIYMLAENVNAKDEVDRLHYPAVIDR